MRGFNLKAFLVFIAYYLIGSYFLGVLFYGVLGIQPTIVSSVVIIVFLLVFWFKFLRDKLFGPGGPFGPK